MKERCAFPAGFACAVPGCKRTAQDPLELCQPVPVKKSMIRYNGMWVIVERPRIVRRSFRERLFSRLD
jgi:hypothetical protein